MQYVQQKKIPTYTDKPHQFQSKKTHKIGVGVYTSDDCQTRNLLYNHIREAAKQQGGGTLFKEWNDKKKKLRFRCTQYRKGCKFQFSVHWNKTEGHWYIKKGLGVRFHCCSRQEDAVPPVFEKPYQQQNGLGKSSTVQDHQCNSSKKELPNHRNEPPHPPETRKPTRTCSDIESTGNKLHLLAEVTSLFVRDGGPSSESRNSADGAARPNRTGCVSPLTTPLSSPAPASSSSSSSSPSSWLAKPVSPESTSSSLISNNASALLGATPCPPQTPMKRTAAAADINTTGSTGGGGTAATRGVANKMQKQVECV